MEYEESLKKLRKQLSFPEPAQDTGAGNGLIPQRSAPQPANDDPLAFAKDWMRVIKSSGEQARSRFATQVKVIENSKPVEEVVELDTGEKETPADEEAIEEVTEPERESAFGKERRSRSNKEDGESFSLPAGEGMTSLMRLMDKHEGGGSYSTLFGHSQKNRFSGVDVSKMTLAEVKDFSNPKGEYGNWVKGQVGRVATPMGRYQFVGSTLRTVQNEMGLTDDTVFNRDTQDAMFEHYLRKRLSQGNTLSEKVTQLRQAWEGFKSVPTAQLSSVIRKIENGSET